tara:strand:+ start:216 stop:443 length:228 start_codon:yes stop_codon:yes gene_type:complete
MLNNLIEFLTARGRLSQLREKVKALEAELAKLEDENRSLWLMLDEIKEEEKAIAARIQEELSSEILRSIEPVGNA